MLSIVGMKHTTIAVSREVRDALAKLGSKDQSFNDIIKNLLEDGAK